MNENTIQEETAVHELMSTVTIETGPRRASAVPDRLEVVKTPERFRQLKAVWDDLWARSLSGGVYQSFDNCLHMWEAIASQEGRSLFCLVAWQGQRALAIWPLTRFRQAAWRCIRPLEASGAEYTDLLLDPDLDAADWLSSALAFLKKQAGSDVLILPYVKIGTSLHEALDPMSGKALIDAECGVCADLRQEPDWDTYYATLSGTMRKKIRNLRRKLEKVGDVKLETIPAGDPRCSQLIDWMLAQKRVWSEKMGKSGPWLASPHYRDFLIRLVSDPHAQPKSFLFTLTANDILLGVKLQSTGKLCEALVAALNMDYEKLSPGYVLDEYCVRWAFDQKLDCDFGNGTERNKLFWSRHQTVPTATYTVPLSWWGLGYLKARDWSRKRKQAANAGAETEAAAQAAAADGGAEE